MMGATYPERPAHFDRRFQDEMAERHLANTIGADGCWLLTVIVRQEDANRYAGPVDFWNGQLMLLVGAGSETSLKRLRAKCIAAGWLHYEAGAKGRAARYWVTIPERSGNPVRGTDSDSRSFLHHNSAPESDPECGRNADGIRPTSLPIPDPTLSSAVQPTAADRSKTLRERKPKAKKPREPDPLFDAVAEVTGSDPKVSASHVAKLRHKLAGADPAYTPEEVREFGRRFLEWCTWARGERDRPTLGELEKYIGQLRASRPPAAVALVELVGKRNPMCDDEWLTQHGSGVPLV